MNESKNIIRKHQTRVNFYLLEIQKMLFDRGQKHDRSKLNNEEFSLFEKYAPLLKTCKYGSKEYKKFLEELSPALEHHYKNNRHHPEHFKRYSCNGCFTIYSEEFGRCKECGYTQRQAEIDISQMNLVDLCEMICDWIAASEQHEDGGDILKSIEINQKRFGYSDDIKSILKNTATLIQESTNE